MQMFFFFDTTTVTLEQMPSTSSLTATISFLIFIVLLLCQWDWIVWTVGLAQFSTWLGLYFLFFDFISHLILTRNKKQNHITHAIANHKNLLDIL